MTKYQLADALKEGVGNGGCAGVSDDVKFAVVHLTPHQRGKIVALCVQLGLTVTEVKAETEEASR